MERGVKEKNRVREGEKERGTDGEVESDRERERGTERGREGQREGEGGLKAAGPDSGVGFLT